MARREKREKTMGREMRRIRQILSVIMQEGEKKHAIIKVKNWRNCRVTEALAVTLIHCLWESKHKQTNVYYN